MILFLAIVTVVVSEQVIMNSEVFDEPVCERSGECFECNFNQMRLLQTCFVTGYIKPIFCTMTSNLNNTQEISYMMSCQVKHKDFISKYALVWILTTCASAFFLFYWRHLKFIKSANHQISLANIIKT